MQPTTTPRLSSDVSAQPGYAPVAWSAVAALALAVGFVVLLLVLAVGSYRNGLPLTDSWIPFVPALVVVLAFVARRQIRASEGTRTGEPLANAAWWVGVVSGVGFVAYLLGVNYTVERDARRVFNEWAAKVAEVDPFNPKDPNLYEACFLTLPPGSRSGSPKDVARMDQAFGDAVAGFRQVDVVRLCQRNRGNLTLAPQGLKDWSVKANEISCVLTAALTSPEGEYGMELPMRAVVDDKGGRRWQIQPPGPDGYVKTRKLTRAGWEAAALEADGQAFGRELLLRMGQPGQAPALYLGYVHPGYDPNRAATTLNQFAVAADPLAALTGAGSLPAVRAELLPRDRQPLPPGWYETLTQKVFGKPDGSPLAAADVERLWRAFSTPAQIAPSGSILRNNPDTNTVLAVGADAVELRMPVEVQTGSSGMLPTAYKGRLVFRLPPDAAASFLARRADAAKSGELTTRPPDDLAPTRQPWRLARVESDLKVVQAEMPQQSRGGPGGMGG